MNCCSLHISYAVQCGECSPPYAAIAALRAGVSCPLGDNVSMQPVHEREVRSHANRIHPVIGTHLRNDVPVIQCQRRDDDSLVDWTDAVVMTLMCSRMSAKAFVVTNPDRPPASSFA